jgi:uncharacterized membrane protein
MADLICVAFDDPRTADRALTELTALQKEYLIELKDACVVVRSPDGEVHGSEMPDAAAGMDNGLGFMLGTALLHAAGISLSSLVAKMSERQGLVVVRATGALAALACLAIVTGPI